MENVQQIQQISQDEYERRLFVQQVIDRALEFGQEYIEQIAELNKKYEPVKHRIL